jgi:SAM-dependent MidA family methyltransferase
MPIESSLRRAWEQTVTGSTPFYRGPIGNPYRHFTTSVVDGDLVRARAANLIGELRTRESGPLTVVDVGSADGDLLRQIARDFDDLRLVGIDLRERPADLDGGIEWITGDIREVTAAFKPTVGVVVAHELLDDIPCDCIEVDADGVVRLVTVDSATLELELGPTLPPGPLQDWLKHWWPAERPYMRAEIGNTRDAVWAGITGMLSRGFAMAVDYGHVDAERRSGFWDGGTLTGYRDGSVVRPTPDGTCNITAHVAMDAIATAAPGASHSDITRWTTAPGRADFLCLVQSFT